MRGLHLLIVALLLLPLLAGVVCGDSGDLPENVPSVPNEQVEYVCPYSVYTANTLQFNESAGTYDALEAYIDMFALLDSATEFPVFNGSRFLTPYPEGDVDVLEDKIWINELVPVNPHLVYGDYEDVVGTVLDALFPGHGYNAIAAFPDIEITPMIILNTTAMPNGTDPCPEITTTEEFLEWAYGHETVSLFIYTLRGLGEWVLNGTINDRSWFPDFLLDFRIYNSAFVDLEMLGSPADVTVYGFSLTNCSRETYWRCEESFLYAYYTTQKKYEVTLSMVNNISVSHYYDVNWYVGFPANRVVEPSSLIVYDLDNAMKLTLGENYDASNAGVWMSFPRIDMSESRSFTFTIYSWNATIGLGMAIAYADHINSVDHEDETYYMGTATWTNDYGRNYQGGVYINIDMEDGSQRFMDPSSVDIYDNTAQRWLEPWEFTCGGGLILVEYAAVAVGGVQSYDVYFQVDHSMGDSLSMTSEFLGMPLWTWFLFAACVGILALWTMSGRTVRGRKLKLNKEAGAFIIVLISIFFILWYFMTVGVL